MYLPTRLPETETRAAETTDPVTLTLLRAAQIIRERGWCQWTYRDQHERVCVTQAIWDAGNLDNAYLHFGEFVTGILDTPTHWNDEVAKSADEVISALESAALSRATAIRGV